MNNTGWIKLHRGLLDWEWYDDSNCFRLFIHLILTVNIKDKKWRGIIIKKGQIVTGRNKLSSETGLSVQQVRTALQKLGKTNEITTQKTPVGTVFTVVNWKKYQSATTHQPESNHASTREQPESNHASTTTKEVQEVKESKEDEEEKPPTKLDEDVYYDIERLKDYYLNFDRLVIAVCKNPDNKLSKEILLTRLEKFNSHLSDTGTFTKKWNDYTSHFLRWHKKNLIKSTPKREQYL